ncbi:MAG: hypothetical protein WKF89_03730 [Chitinophagaceae bacterium]
MKMFVPQEYLNDFVVNYIKERTDEWIIELVEKEDRIPDVLKGKHVVLDGYCNDATR